MRRDINAIAAIRKKATTHPGGFIRHKVLTPLGLSVTAAAQALPVARATLPIPLDERASRFVDMAFRVEKAFGMQMGTLMRMQSSSDITQARNCEGAIKVAPFKGKRVAPCTAA